MILGLLWSQADTFIRRRFALALLLTLVSSTLTGAAPLLLKMAVDALSEPQSDVPYFAPAALVLAYASNQWLVRSLQEARELAYGIADYRLQRRLSLHLFGHVMKLPLSFHLDRKTGALGQTLNNGLLGCRLVIHHLVFSALPVIIEVAMMMSILIFLGQPVFLAIIGAALLSYILAFTACVVRIAGTARGASAAHIDANAVLIDSILNYETVKCFNAEGVVQEHFDAALVRTERQWRQFYVQKLGNGLIVAAIFALSLGISMIVAAGAVSRGSLSIGEFVLVHTYLLQLVRPVEMLGFALRDIAHGLAFIEKMADLLRKRPEEETRERTEDLAGGRGDLVFDRVSFSYRPGRPVVADVSFAIPAGKTVAVVGASGSGKSSLVRLLLRFCEPDSGRILLDGTPISEVSVSALRETIAVVPQDTVLFNDSIAYNIGIGRPRCPAKDIARAAKVAHLHEFIASQPDGYETKVGERGVKLSGGEKQRVAIARAALKTPRIFVFDEATSSLDSKTEQEILSNIRDVSRGATTLIIAHRLSTVTDADEIVVLGKGRVLEHGTHQDLLRKDGAYASLWVAQEHQDQPDTRAAEVP
ncbi:MAG: ATP-binding cassette domain-containing protein [Woeseia sp.]